MIFNHFFTHFLIMLGFCLLCVGGDASAMKIVTVFEQNTALSKKADAVLLTTEGLLQAKILATQLIETLTPLMPAAGLAASQIGISQQVFIFSWNRSVDTLEVVLNPTVLTESAETVRRWEACFSTIQDQGESLAAQVERPNTIEVEYYTLEGSKVRKRLTGFAARVFLHEYDHLNGLENIKKEGAESKVFSDKTSLIQFMTAIKSQDSVSYQQPVEIPE